MSLVGGRFCVYTDKGESMNQENEGQNQENENTDTRPNNILLSQISELLDQREYGKQYEKLRRALEEAHQNLTREDIVELFKEADEIFADMHECTCGKCDGEGL
jgi:hypothetical protein